MATNNVRNGWWMGRSRLWRFGIFALAAAVLSSCTAESILNPSFLNQQTGSIFPLVPGDRSAFILVRGNNSTSVAIEFVITAERLVPSDDGTGAQLVQRETFRVFTPPDNRANDVGVLFDCPVLRVGLGENLDRPASEAGVFVNAMDVGVGGFGVPTNVNPLDTRAGNFDCGDTIVFQASEANNTVGGVQVLSFVLSDAGFPTQVSRSDTFVNVRNLIEEANTNDE